MTASKKRTLRIAAVSLAMLILGADMACSDFPRVNPFDAQGNLTLVLTGPDSATAIGDTVVFQLRTTSGESVEQLAGWSVPPFLSFTPRYGQFVVTGTAGSPRGTGTVTAKLNANEASMPFTYAQQVVSLSVSDCLGQKVMSFDYIVSGPTVNLAGTPVCAVLLDRRGGQVNGALSGTWETRSQQIVQVVAGPQAAAVHPLSVGSTYVVYTQAALRDSVRVDVRQDIAHLTIDPPSCEAGVRATLHPAETLQLSARAPAYDANRSIVTDTALVRAALQTVLWSVQGPLSLAVSSSGLVTALAPGQGWVFGSIYRDGGWIEVMGCPVEVL